MPKHLKKSTKVPVIVAAICAVLVVIAVCAGVSLSLQGTADKDATVRAKGSITSEDVEGYVSMDELQGSGAAGSASSTNGSDDGSSAAAVDGAAAGGSASAGDSTANGSSDKTGNADGAGTSSPDGGSSDSDALADDGGSDADTPQSGLDENELPMVSAS